MRLNVLILGQYSLMIFQLYKYNFSSFTGVDHSLFCFMFFSQGLFRESSLDPQKGCLPFLTWNIFFIDFHHYESNPWSPGDKNPICCFPSCYARWKRQLGWRKKRENAAEQVRSDKVSCMWESSEGKLWTRVGGLQDKHGWWTNLQRSDPKGDKEGPQECATSKLLSTIKIKIELHRLF